MSSRWTPKQVEGVRLVHEWETYCKTLMVCRAGDEKTGQLRRVKAHNCYKTAEAEVAVLTL